MAAKPCEPSACEAIAASVPLLDHVEARGVASGSGGLAA
jgi:hypothetical protein